MRKSGIFEQNHYLKIQDALQDFINRQSDFLTESTISSPRAVGDALQKLLETHFGTLLGGHAKEYSADFARRSMADLAFTDTEDFYHIVDIKTHRLDTRFNMPNLTSVRRLAQYYQDDSRYFDLLLVAYTVDGLHIDVKNVHFVPIEYLSWDCLTIGALGEGQIQIASSNRILLDPSLGRVNWMLRLCARLMEFYPKEIKKIEERIERFEEVRRYWQSRAE